jgi:REP-associated tyrosine transposase
MVTSNHTHLLVFGTGHDAIPKSIQLVAGRTAREYNLRKTEGAHFGKIDTMLQPLKAIST